MKQDHKLVSSKEDNEREIKYIASTYKIPIKVVRAAIAELKKEGKGYRSRRSVYAKLREMGYNIKTK